MSKQDIKLGDEIEDITCMVRGIATGHVYYLDGSEAWLLQPPYNDDGGRIPIVEVQIAYAKRIGDGVRIQSKPTVGFRGMELQE